jgi:hypothetical protein
MPNLDHPDLADDRAAFEARLAEYGPETVVAMLAHGMFPTTSNVVILEWLKAQKKAADASD